MKRLALYARVSTYDQHPDAQLGPLRAYAARCHSVDVQEYVDHGVSGKRDRRLALDQLMEAVRRREVDAVVVVKLDRLARSTRHLCELAEEFERLGVALVVLDQAIDTTTPSGRLLFAVLAAVASFERDLIVERTRAGLEAAKRRGKKLGRPRKVFDRRLVERAGRLRTAGKSVREIARLIGVSATIAHRMLKAR